MRAVVSNNRYIIIVIIINIKANIDHFEYDNTVTKSACFVEIASGIEPRVYICLMDGEIAMLLTYIIIIIIIIFII